MGLDVNAEVWIGNKMRYGEFWRDADKETRLCSSHGSKDGTFCDECGDRTALGLEQTPTALMVRLAQLAGKDPKYTWESMVTYGSPSGDLSMKRVDEKRERPAHVLLGRLVCATPSHRSSFPVARIGDDDVKREMAVVMSAFKALDFDIRLQLQLYVVADVSG